MSAVASVNVGRPRPDAHKPWQTTGIDKAPVPSIEVSAPPPRSVTKDLGPAARGGVAGDYIGDGRFHGGDLQAVYAFASEDLVHLGGLVGREFQAGCFGENLTTSGVDVTGALVGERWRVGSGDDAVELVVTLPRIPCHTFRAWIDERGWLKTFTAQARPGAYLAVSRPGTIRPGDAVEVLFRPEHDVTIGVLFRSQTLERDLAARVLTAREYLEADSIEYAQKRVSAAR